MEWSNAKRATMILFIVLNIVLYSLNTSKYKSLYELDNNMIDIIKKDLKSSNIIINSNIPNKFYPMSKLNVEPKFINLNRYKDGKFTQDKDGSIIYRETEDKNIENVDKIKKYVENFIKNIDKNLVLSDYYVISEGDNKKEYAHIFKYNSKIKDKLIFGSYIELRFTRGKIEEAKIYLLDYKDQARESNIKSSVNILSNFKSVKEKENKEEQVKIRDIAIGYSSQGEPVYRIITHKNRFYYFNAYTNELQSR